MCMKDVVHEIRVLLIKLMVRKWLQRERGP